MTKDKRQLRAEAAERLRGIKLDPDGTSHARLSAICRAIYRPPLGWAHDACKCLMRTLIDLLTDDETCAENYIDAEAEARSPRSHGADSGGHVTSEEAEVTFADCQPMRDLADECAELERIVDRLTAERDGLQRAAERDADVMECLNDELANMTGSRDHWRRVAGKHAKEMQTLRRALKLEQERTVNELPEGVEWPHFEDGACVGIGDAFVGCDGEPHELACVKFLDDGYWMTEGTSDQGGVGFGGFTSLGCGFWSYGEMFERPPVLASDGQPIEVGQVYFGLSDGKAWEVEGFDRKRKRSVWAHDVENPEKRKCLKPEWLSHGRPDSWEDVAATVRSWREVDPDETRVTVMAYALDDLAERIEKLAKEGA